MGQDTTTTRREPRRLFFKHIARKIFFEDWALKLTALAITLALWFGVTGLSTPQDRNFIVPLTLNIANNAEITNANLQQEVTIFVRGDKRKLDQIRASELAAFVDLTAVPPGNKVLSLTPDSVYVNLPVGVTLEQIIPTGIGVNIEAVEEKDIEVKVKADGSPPAGYEVYYSTALPSKIRVRGPASFIKTLDFVETDKIDITGKKEEFTARQIPVSVSNPKAAVLNTVVDVYFRIGEKRDERAFSSPVTGETGKTASFVLYGPRTVLQKARPDQFKVEMYLNDNGEEAPRVVLPPELQDVVEIRKLRVNR